MKNWNLRKRIFLSVTSICIVLVLIATAIFSYFYVNDNIQNLIQDKQNESFTISKSVNSWMDRNESFIMQLFYDKNLSQICDIKSDNLYKLEMDEYLRMYYSTSGGLYAIRFTDRLGRYSQITGLDYAEMDKVSSIYQKRAEASPSDFVWDVVNTTKGKKIVLARKISQLDAYMKSKQCGVVVILIDVEQLYKLYGETTPAYKSRTLVLGTDSLILSSSNADDIGRTFNKCYTLNNSLLRDASGKAYYYVSSRANATAWQVVIVIPKSEVLGLIYSTATMISIVVIVLLIIATFFANINQSLRMQLLNKETQLKAYAMQINPHFIYNTLDMIRMMAVMDDTDKIDEAVVCLSHLLRFNNRGDNEVRIQDEIDSVKDYFKILKLRYGDDFEYEFDVPDEVLSCYTLKFLLQPIAENAVKHGLEGIDRVGHIKVMARRMKGELILMVKDNGVGMSEEALQALRNELKALDGTTIQTKSIGMSNVYQRIKLYYGEPFGLDIESIENEKTVVSIHIPAKGAI